MSDELSKKDLDLIRKTSKVFFRIVQQTPEQLEEKRKFAEAHGMPNTVDYDDDEEYDGD